MKMMNYIDIAIKCDLWRNMNRNNSRSIILSEISVVFIRYSRGGRQRPVKPHENTIYEIVCIIFRSDTVSISLSLSVSVSALFLRPPGGSMFENKMSNLIELNMLFLIANQTRRTAALLPIMGNSGSDGSAASRSPYANDD